LGAGRGGGWSADTQPASNDIKAIEITDFFATFPVNEDIPILSKPMARVIDCNGAKENCQCQFCDERFPDGDERIPARSQQWIAGFT
jgi:hypothetical protein